MPLRCFAKNENSKSSNEERSRLLMSCNTAEGGGYRLKAKSGNVIPWKTVNYNQSKGNNPLGWWMGGVVVLNKGINC
jgi:hypothetical protein